MSLHSRVLSWLEYTLLRITPVSTVCSNAQICQGMSLEKKKSHYQCEIVHVHLCVQWVSTCKVDLLKEIHLILKRKTVQL